MNQKQLIRWGSLVGFLVLAGMSCWLTERSAHLIFPTWPVVAVWAVTILLFILASIGTMLVVEACNRDKYVDHRRLRFWGGLILVLVCWLGVSLPTNIHTLFYDSYVGNVANKDIDKTNSYLSQISTRQNQLQAYDSIYNLVTSRFDLVASEFNGGNRPGHPGNRSNGHAGNGEFTKDEIRAINNILGHEGVPQQSQIRYDARHNSTDQAILSHYERQMREGLEYLRNKYSVPQENADTAMSTIRKLNILKNEISYRDQIGEVDDNIIFQTQDVLNYGYNQIKVAQKYIVFANDAEKEYYTSDNPETLTKRMLSPYDVLTDFFAGKYPKTFLYSIFFSILIDLGAFIFFDIAFRKE